MIISRTATDSKVTFQVQGRHGVYTVTRIGSKTWTCTCPATVLCRHIKAAVQNEAKAKGFYAQFCKTPEAVKRQRRRHFEISAKNKPVAVCYRRRPRNVNAEARAVEEQIAALDHKWHVTPYGAEKYRLRDEMEILNQRLAGLRREQMAQIARRMK